MGKTILKTVLAVVAGGVIGSVVMMLCHFATMPLYPPPEGLDVMDPEQREAVTAWMGTLPDGAFVVAALCHWIGTAAGAVVAMLITRRRSLRPAFLVGVLFTLAGVYNVTMMPHPTWFPYVDFPGYLIAALLIGKLMVRAPQPAQ